MKTGQPDIPLLALGRDGVLLGRYGRGAAEMAKIEATDGSSTQLRLPLEAIRTDGDTQPREKLNRTVIGDYARAKKDGAAFPPVIVFHDGENYWLADGFHRTEADRKIGAADVVCEVRPGSQRDAQLYSFGANAAHGLRRTNADKRRAVLAMLADPVWTLWTGAEVARACAVTKIGRAHV